MVEPDVISIRITLLRNNIKTIPTEGSDAPR